MYSLITSFKFVRKRGRGLAEFPRDSHVHIKSRYGMLPDSVFLIFFSKNEMNTIYGKTFHTRHFPLLLLVYPLPKPLPIPPLTPFSTHDPVKQAKTEDLSDSQCRSRPQAYT